MNLHELNSQAQQEITHANNLETLESLRLKYLSKNGLLNQTFQELIKATEDKKALGQQFNQTKQSLEAAFTDKLSTINQELSTNNSIDLTVPGNKPAIGHLHPVTHAIEEITHIFNEIGFTRMRYPEVDWDYYVFEGLNFPPNHPARDDQETYWLNTPAHPDYGPMVMTTHTSNGQIREMERISQHIKATINPSSSQVQTKGSDASTAFTNELKPKNQKLETIQPIRMINIGKCYRRQQDLTHTHMFHQFEGMVVDKGINITHLKGTIDYFCSRFYGPQIKSRLRPHHFQFTEPSFEVDFTCTLCNGTTELKNGQKCRFCKGGWLEVGGSGMIHPNVLKAGFEELGDEYMQMIDSGELTGFAFGWGVERAYTIKPGLQIDDIRLFYNNSYDFLQQF